MRACRESQVDLAPTMDVVFGSASKRNVPSAKLLPEQSTKARDGDTCQQLPDELPASISPELSNLLA